MDIVILAIVLYITIVVSYKFSKKLPLKFQSSVWLILIMHCITTISYYLFIMKVGGDAYRYWNVGRQLSWELALPLLLEGKGTYFMEAFNYFFSGALGLGFFANSCVYALFGYLGVLYFYKIAMECIPFNSKIFQINLFPFLFYIPMLHFWSSGVGKDTLLFTCIAFFSYGLMNIPRRFLMILFSFLFSYVVRPHIALLLIVGFGLAYLLDSRTAVWKRSLLGTVMLASSIALLPMVLEYVKLEEISVESISSYSNSQAEKLSRSGVGSSVDISSYPAPLKWFTFLFRPLFFDINGIPALVSSFENLFLLLLFFKVLTNNPIEAFRTAPFVIKGLALFLILGTVLMSGSLGNLGIMIRMRNMFLPGMMIYFLWVLSYAQMRNSYRMNNQIN